MDVPAAGAPATRHLGPALAVVRTEVLSETAAKLGISVDQLRAELQAGTPLAHIAALAGMSVQQPAAAAVVVAPPPPAREVDVRL